MKFENLYKLIIASILVLVITTITFYSSGNDSSIVNSSIVKVQNKEEKKNDALVIKGKYFFTKKCVECHDLDLKKKGPPLRDVTSRRKKDWIIMMILNPDELLKKDPEAKILLKRHIIKMVVKDVDLEQAKALLEYLRSVNI